MDKDTVFNDNPGRPGPGLAGPGSRMLHIVDLDGAFAGEPRNRSAIEAIVKAITIPAQLGGGIRDLATIEAYLSLGLSRVIIGTAAQRNPELVREACAKFPGRIVVGIDAKNGMVAVQGWAEVTDITAVDLARKFEGLRRVRHHLYRHQPRRHAAGAEPGSDQGAGRGGLHPDHRFGRRIVPERYPKT